MTLNRRSLNKWAESAFTVLTKEQKRVILERFGTEPEPYEWTEQDIFIQIRNYLSSGEFVKTMQNTIDTSTDNEKYDIISRGLPAYGRD